MVQGSSDWDFDPLSRQRGPTFKFSFGLQQQDSICREAIDAFVRLPFGRLFLSNKKNVNIPINNCGDFNCYSLRLEKCCETNRIQQRRHKLWQVDCLFRLEDDKRSDWWCSVPLCQLPWLDHHCLGRKTSDSPTTCLNSPAQYRQPQSRWVPLKICQSE
jgi:hypothetical protein